MSETTNDAPGQAVLKVEQGSSGDGSVLLSGTWTLSGLTHQIEEIRSSLHPLVNQSSLTWDMRPVEALDRLGAVVLWQAWQEQLPRTLQLRPEHETLFAELQRLSPIPDEGSRWQPLRVFKSLAAGLLALWDHFKNGMTLLGQLVLDMQYVTRHPGQFPWRAISANIYSAGARALSITALVGLLIGVVISYLSAVQLQFYGAQGFIVDVLGLSIIRELGPMLAAILVAGRSGSAMTAELGVMRVTRELDALATLGISPTIRLILPKVVALIIALPLLVVWTDAVALMGGMLAAQVIVNVDYGQFLTSLPTAVPVANYWIGLTKGAVFGAVVALTACHFGLRIRPNTHRLAAETTNSVVTAITLLILMDALFAILSQHVGI